ncbi:MAG TPA: Arm DNA-binding domain-containing protein, partial [Devosia sp.]|nr:Arm DNA-binding domain-containing protein [Devosia sp.]
MSATKITRLTVDAAEPRGTTYAIWDALVPGFGLRVFPSGKKSWILYYRPYPGGAKTPKRTALIGSADELSPDQARKRADDIRSQIRVGTDPHATKIATRQGLTIAELADEFMSRKIVPKRSPNTAAAYRDVFDRIVKPKFGTKRAEHLSSREVSALHAETGEDRVLPNGELVPGRPYQANKVLAVLSSMYGWASGPVGLIPENVNPTRRIERFEEKV